MQHHWKRFVFLLFIWYIHSCRSDFKRPSRSWKKKYKNHQIRLLFKQNIIFGMLRPGWLSSSLKPIRSHHRIIIHYHYLFSHPYQPIFLNFRYLSLIARMNPSPFSCFHLLCLRYFDPIWNLDALNLYWSSDIESGRGSPFMFMCLKNLCIFL